MNPCTFGPGIPDTCLATPHAAPWWATETPLWVYLSAVALVALASWSASWLKDHYAMSGRRPVRRWYGTGAWVTLRRDGCFQSPDRWQVTAWSDEATGVPWLLVSPVDNEDSEAFWAAVTDFDPFAIRQFRPHLWRGWLPVLTARVLLEGGTS
ncbi:MAG TPA: hypothetical protein VGS62_03495 [Streptosporangiaceae bacterium]|nr:hypothetical protein [Streptosporangiaceae bacterium]